MIQALFASEPSVPLLLVRLGLGTIFAAHGAQKVLGWFEGGGVRGAVAYFEGLGIPRLVGLLVCVSQLLAGLALLAGLLTRPAALVIAVQMLFAIVRVHGREGFFLNFRLEPGKGHGIEYALALLAMAAALLVGGGGLWSADRLLGRL